MSSLLASYQQITNQGVPNGTLVSGEEHLVVGETTMLLAVNLGTGSATLSIDNGAGFVTEDLVNGNTEYRLKPCKLKVTIIGDAVISSS